MVNAVNRCAVNVGRLVEIRAEAGYRQISDVQAIFQSIGREMGKLPVHQRVVVVTDWRRCPVMSADASESLKNAIIGTNPRIERSASLVSRDAPTAVLQLARIVRESNLPDRRQFDDADELTGWLAEVLDRAELARLKAFLAYQEHVAP
jgi:hypothetical protein